MPRANNPNLLMLEMAAEKLGPLVDIVVFLGGCATGLLITDPAAPPLRVTRDVDVIVEVASLSSYHRFSSKLRKRGFVEDSSQYAAGFPEALSLMSCRRTPIYSALATNGLKRRLELHNGQLCRREKPSKYCQLHTLSQRRSKRFITEVTMISF